VRLARAWSAPGVAGHPLQCQRLGVEAQTLGNAGLEGLVDREQG
jgi:hypothetical protein